MGSNTKERSWTQGFRNFFSGLKDLLILAIVAGVIWLGSPIALQVIDVVDTAGQYLKAFSEMFTPERRHDIVALTTTINSIQILELATEKDEFKKDALVYDSVTAGFLGPIAHSEFRCSFTGYVKAGFNLDKRIGISIDPDRGLVVNMPEPEILDVSMDFGNDCLQNQPMFTLITNPFETFFKEDYSKLKNEMKNDSLNKKILDRAKTSAVQKLGPIFSAFGFEEKNIVWVFGDMEYRPKG